MKLLILVFSLLFLVACGKGGSSSGEKLGQQQRYESIPANDFAPDLLNATLSLPVEISGDRIHFLSGGNATDQGVRIKCALSVQSGELWHFQLSGTSLVLDTGNGRNLSMQRQASIGQAPEGVWSWRGQENGMNIIRRFSLLNGRMIMNQDCEG